VEGRRRRRLSGSHLHLYTITSSTKKYNLGWLPFFTPLQMRSRNLSLILVILTCLEQPRYSIPSMKQSRYPHYDEQSLNNDSTQKSKENKLLIIHQYLRCDGTFPSIKQSPPSSPFRIKSMPSSMEARSVSIAMTRFAGLFTGTGRGS
jgi:hypothetical protein